MASPKICLNMIVKNESKIIERCLDSVRSIVDYVVITDTGSTDNTIQLINDYLKRNKISGKVFEKPWRDFGFNRTNSIENAKKFLKDIGENLSTVFLFFMDADMKIVIEDEFNKKSLSLIQYGQIIQKNSTMKYYNTRFARADLYIKCLGVTHEYYDTKGITTKIDTIYIDDIGDGGAKADKFERDIRLLEQGLIDEPNNQRYYFYLAQSYCCVGNTDKAIANYQKRIEIGGWREEVYYSYLQIGDMYKDKLNDWPKALENYLLSYNASEGIRSEGLVKIAEYYRNISKHHLSFNFIKQALAVPYPKDDVLFIDYGSYKYKPIYELSIIAYYLKKRQLGMWSTQYLLLDPESELPRHLEGNVKNNLVFYLNKIGSTSISEITGLNLLEHFKASSSSLQAVEGKENHFQGVFRTVNYHIDEKGYYHYPPSMPYIDTQNYWTVLNGNNVIEQHHITIAKDCYKEYSRESVQVRGLEDGRHIIYKGEIYCSFTSFEYGPECKPCIVLTHIRKDNYQIDRIVPLKYRQDLTQKNWVPFEYNGDLCFVYSYEPFIILKVNPETGDCKEIIKKEFAPDLEDLRGSTPPIWIPDQNGYLLMTHEVIFGSTRKYIHRFLLFDDKFNLRRVSEPFYFNNLFIEFSLSIIYDLQKREVVIPYSHMDNKPFMARVPFDNIVWLPVNIRKAIETVISS